MDQVALIPCVSLTPQLDPAAGEGVSGSSGCGLKVRVDPGLATFPLLPVLSLRSGNSGCGLNVRSDPGVLRAAALSLRSGSSGCGLKVRSEPGAW